MRNRMHLRDNGRLNPNCRYPQHYHHETSRATDIEIVDGVWGMVRLLQPQVVLESGTHVGAMAVRIGEALQQNNHGRLYTVETEERFFNVAKERCAELPVTVIRGDILSQETLDVVPDGIDMVWFDDLEENAGSEFAAWWPKLRSGAIVMWHDTAGFWAPTQGRIKDGIRLAKNAYPPLTVNLLSPLPTPTGMTIAQVIK